MADEASAETTDHLRDAISGAIDTSEKQTADAVTAPVVQTDNLQSDGAGKTGTDAQSLSTPATDAPEKTQTAPAIEPHASWPKDAKERFTKLDKDSQTFLLDRERSMQADYTRKTQEIAALKRDFEPVEKLFAPYRDQMKTSGQTPHSLIEGWANVEKALMGGKGIDVIRGIVQGYKLNPQEIITALSNPAQRQTQPVPGTQPQQQPAFQLPPDVQAKLQKIDQFESRFNAEDQARANAEINKVSNEIEDFKSAKDAQGNALHPHFEEVEQQMAVLVHVMKAQGQTPKLQDLYESAVYAIPSTRAKVLAAEKQAEEKRVKDEARAKAEKARRASSSVTGSPSNGSGQSLTNGRDNSMSLRDQIAQNVSEHAS